MYEMKDWEDAGQMLDYLNNLPEHQVVTLLLDPNGWWRSVVRIEALSQVDPVLQVGPPRKPRMVRPKGWKPGDPYVPMEEK